jgi:hypothetical protein
MITFRDTTISVNNPQALLHFVLSFMLHKFTFPISNPSRCHVGPTRVPPVVVILMPQRPVTYYLLYIAKHHHFYHITSTIPQLIDRYYMINRAFLVYSESAAAWRKTKRCL